MTKEETLVRRLHREEIMSYKSWLKRKENATPYANEANCRRCIHGEWVRKSAFCNGNGKPKKIPYKAWDTDKIGYCPEFTPRQREIDGKK